MTVYRAAVLARDTVTSPACDLSQRARFLLLLLATYADGTGSCHPAVKTLARALDCHPGSVRKARAELVSAGVIAVDLRGGRETNRYRFPFAVEGGNVAPLRLVEDPPADPPADPPEAPADPAGDVHTPRPTARGHYPHPAPHDAHPAPGGAGTPRPGARPSRGTTSGEEEVAPAVVNAADGDPVDVAIPVDAGVIWRRARDAHRARSTAAP